MSYDQNPSVLFQGVQVVLFDQFSIYATTTTNDQGFYEFSGVPTDQLFVVELRNGGNVTAPSCGLNQADQDFLKNFILTFGANNSSDGFWRLIAGDVNQSGSVSASDLVSIEKCWRFSDCAFPTFKFLPKEAYISANAEYMQAGGGLYWPSYETQIYVYPGTNDLLDQDFYGIKMGDPISSCNAGAFIIGKNPDFEFDFNTESTHVSAINFRGSTEQNRTKSIKIYDINGVLLISEKSDSFNIEWYQLSTGIYIKETEDQSGKLSFQKLFIRQ